MHETDSARTAWDELTQHRWWPYRACAPDEDNPTVIAADGVTSPDVWIAPLDEPQRDRIAREATAKALCAQCPIVNACLTYALGNPTAGQHETSHVWGGLTAGERARNLKDATTPTPEPATAAAAATDAGLVTA